MILTVKKNRQSVYFKRGHVGLSLQTRVLGTRQDASGTLFFRFLLLGRSRLLPWTLSATCAARWEWSHLCLERRSRCFGMDYASDHGCRGCLGRWQCRQLLLSIQSAFVCANLR